jgi:hypothetical protein
MAQDLTVTLEDRPGALAEMGEALGKVGINIDGMCGFTFDGKGEIHILVEDVAGARRALEAIGIEVGAAIDVLIVDAEDRPGMLGTVAREIADAGVNITVFYKATKTNIVFGVDDLEKAKAVV